MHTVKKERSKMFYIFDKAYWAHNINLSARTRSIYRRVMRG